MVDVEVAVVDRAIGDHDERGKGRIASAHGVHGAHKLFADLVEAMDAVSNCDASLAALVVTSDRPINHRYLDIHREAIALLASQAPVAGDLRLVAALLHIVWCLERMGDQCVNVAKLVPLSGHESPRDEEMLAAIERHGAARGSADRPGARRRSSHATSS